jgi:hypothetical protein
MLTLAGRTEDVLTLPDGSQLSPATIENELALSPYIADALVLQQAGQLTALLMVEQEALEGWAQQNGIAFTGFQGLLRAPEALALVAQAVEAANGRAPGNRRVARFRLLDRALGPDDPELTVRDLGVSRQPVRVVVSRGLDLPEEGRLPIPTASMHRLCINKKAPTGRWGLVGSTGSRRDHLPIFGGSRKAMAKNNVAIARVRIRM